MNELDAALVELDCSAATDERGMRAVLRHMVPTSYFLAFMFDEHSIENLVRFAAPIPTFHTDQCMQMFYLDIVHFRREILATGDQAKWRETALSIFYCYIKKGAPLELNLVSSVQNALQNALSPEMLKGDCESLKTVYDDAFEACRILMQDTWRRYQRSEIFQKSTRRLTGADLTDVKVRRAAMREVLYHFRNVVGVPDTYTTIVKGKVLAYYRRLNAGNSSIDLEAQSIIDVRVSFLTRCTLLTRRACPELHRAHSECHARQACIRAGSDRQGNASACGARARPPLSPSFLTSPVFYR